VASFDSNLLDTLIKLASLGTSGICIFAIFWIGYLISRLAAPVDPGLVATYRFYMITCLLIAVISATSGGLNAYFNRQQIVTLRQETTGLSEKLASANENASSLKTEVQKKEEQIRGLDSNQAQLLQHLDVILKHKEVLAKASSSSDAVRESVKMLQEMIAAEKDKAALAVPP
jgi:hypothetical protein